MRRYKQMILVRNKLNQTIRNNNHILLSTYVNHDIDILIDFNCGHKPQYIHPDSYMTGHNRCRFCTNQRTIEFENDIYTKRPDLIPYFKYESDSIGIAVTSNKTVQCVCPICGKEKKYKVSLLSHGGFACDNCRDSKSFPEKVMGNILDDLNIEYQTEVRFEWCVFEIDNKQCNGYYDIVIESMKTIIEMDGLFHYKETEFGSLEIIKLKDENKTKLALENGYKIYRVNCGYLDQSQKYKWTKDNILKTLGNVFDLSTINWDSIYKRSDKPIIQTASELWNEGYSTNYITSKLHVSVSCLVDILNRGHKLGICSYTKEESNMRAGYFRTYNHNKYLKMMKDGKITGVLWDFNIFIANYKKKYSLPMSRSSINRVLRGESHATIGGEIFIPITKEEYINLLNLPNVVTDDGIGNNDDIFIRANPEYVRLVFPNYQ